MLGWSISVSILSSVRSCYCMEYSSITDLNIFFKAKRKPVLEFLKMIKIVPALNNLTELSASKTFSCLEKSHIDRMLIFGFVL
jgi:hypothetical protein